MKFSVTFDTETKVAKFYINEIEADYDNFEISKEVKTAEQDSGKICTEYSRIKNGVEECHEIEFSPETGEVIHYQSLTSSMLNTPLQLIIDTDPEEKTETEKEEDMLDKIFSPKLNKEAVKETKINELIPGPDLAPVENDEEENVVPNDNTNYLPIFYPKNN